jgi:hypothetical protein
MPTPTYTPLATVTLGSSASSVTFSSIPATYRDLILVGDLILSTSNAQQIRIRFNGDTGSNYFTVNMGATTTTFSQTSTLSAGRIGQAYNGSRSTHILNLMDYSATDKHKTGTARGDNASNRIEALATRWANTAAITSMTVIIEDASNFAAGSTFNLYGVIA